MRNDPNRSYSKLVDTLLSIKIEKLRTFLRNSPAANLVEEKIENRTSSAAGGHGLHAGQYCYR